MQLYTARLYASVHHHSSSLVLYPPLGVLLQGAGSRGPAEGGGTQKERSRQPVAGNAASEAPCQFKSRTHILCQVSL